MKAVFLFQDCSEVKSDFKSTFWPVIPAGLAITLARASMKLFSLCKQTEEVFHLFRMNGNIGQVLRESVR